MQPSLRARVPDVKNVATPEMSRERGTPLHDELRELLKERRQRAKLTQQELADRLGWDRRTVSKIELGSQRVTVMQFLEWAWALDFDAAAAIRRLERRIRPDTSDST
jgi:DNA-binding XRE family transcriptional regulator